MAVVSVDNIIRNNHFYYFINFMMLQQKNDTYFKGKFQISRAFNNSGATRTVALNISKAFCRVWHAGALQKLLSLMKFQSDI